MNRTCSNNIGSSNRLMYDRCSTQERLDERVEPLSYALYFGKHENCNKCKHDKFWTRHQLVDQESDLMNLNLPLSHCNQFKRGSECQKSGLCLSTFDESRPVVLPPEVCPIVYNNIPRHNHPGYHMPDPNFCHNVSGATHFNKAPKRHNH
jgi:hypothetical protein